MELNEEPENYENYENNHKCINIKKNHLRGIDLLVATNDSIKIAIGITFLSYGFHISKYNINTIIRRTIVYAIFILIYKQYISDYILNMVTDT